MVNIHKIGNLIVLDVYWFQKGGILLGIDEITREYKSYIKSNEESSWNSEKDDIEEIAKWGNKFPLEAAKGLFTRFDLNKDWIEDHPEYFV